MAANTEQSTGLLAVGHQCSAQHCGLVDFLPFKCSHCEQKFCNEHKLPGSHNCEKYAQFDRIAPSCPLCNTPVTIPVGEDPNNRMELHITTECSVMTGMTKKSTTPHCAYPKCKKVLFAPITCNKCSGQFCAQHRFPTDHTCKTTTSKPRAPANSSASTQARGLGNDESPMSNAAMAAIKRSMASTKFTVKPTPSSSSKVEPPQPVQKLSSTSTSSSSKTTLNPLSATDRRIRAERKSRMKSMEERKKKGLLSEEDAAVLAAEKARDKDEGCLTM